VRKKIRNGLAAYQIKRQVQPDRQNKKISKYPMDAFAQRQANFGLRKMYQNPRKNKINYGV